MAGRSLAHRSKLTASQRAVIVANIDDSVIPYQPTQAELAKALKVSLPMVHRAKRLSPLARQHVMSGKVTVGHYAKPADPKPVIINEPTPAEQLSSMTGCCA
jgi:hypothetical protein